MNDQQSSASRVRSLIRIVVMELSTGTCFRVNDGKLFSVTQYRSERSTLYFRPFLRAMTGQVGLRPDFNQGLHPCKLERVATAVQPPSSLLL